jgi:hypothetical protein
MCSSDRQEVENLKSTLFRAGIRSEIQSNPLAHAMGITRLEVHVDERDLLRASKVRQQFDPAGTAEEAAASPRPVRSGNGSVEVQESELVLETEPFTNSTIDPPPAKPSGTPSQTGQAEPGGEFEQATALLENEVEELIAREGALVARCCSLEKQVKSLDESLAQARLDVAREASNRSGAEKQLAEIREARVSLGKDMQALESRFKAAEEALAASQARLESQSQESKNQGIRLADLTKEISLRDAKLEKIAESLAIAHAGIEQEKSLRLAAEQKSADLEAARQSIESQLAQQTQQRELLLNERRDEHEQLRACVGKVNGLRERLRATLSGTQK